MDSLPTWAIWAIVAGSAPLGLVVAFLTSLGVAVAIRKVTAADEPPALVFVAAGAIGRFLRRKLGPRPEVASGSPARRAGAAPPG
jgi:hypothetical protein